MRLPDWKALFRKWDREYRMPSVESAIGKYPQALKPPDRNEILAWIDQWHNKIPLQASEELLGIIGKPK